jgi:hypothetical protein
MCWAGASTRAPAGHADAALVGAALGPAQAGLEMGADPAVVGHEDDDRVVGQAEFVDGFQQAVEVFVDAGDHAVDAGVDQREALAEVFLDVRIGHVVRAVRRVVRQIEEERPILVGPHEGDGPIGEHVGDVAGGLDRGHVLEQLVGVEVAVDEAILPESEELVESAHDRVVLAVAAQVPLADEGGAIAVPGEHLSEGDLGWVHDVAAQVGVDRSGALGVPTGH